MKRKIKNETEAQRLRRFKANAMEADAFNPHQFSIPELKVERNRTLNPLLQKKIDQYLKSYTEIDMKAKAQNAENLEKLKLRMSDAINGMPLRRVKRILKKMAKKNKRDMELMALHLMLETEFANLCAKKASKNHRAIYDRKARLLEALEPILSALGWRYGIKDASGKHAKYIIFCYLPTGDQVSWHCNDFELRQSYPYIDVDWDGRPCTTLCKLLDCISGKYFSGHEPPSAKGKLVA